MLTKSDLLAIKSLIVNEVDSLRHELKDEIVKFKDQILTRLDEVMGELKTSREEQTVISGRTYENVEALEDHETRIEKLEKIPQHS